LKDFLMIVGLVAGYLILQRWILPRMGVQT
jgi:hypothetical protein